MTAPARPVHQRSLPASRSGWGRALRWSAGGSVALASFWVLLANGVSVQETARYAAYFVVGVTVPGVIVHRLLRGQRPSLVEDLGLGVATGISLELLAGFVLGALGADQLSRWWWLAVYGLWLAVPPVRRRVIHGPWERCESVAQAWAIASVCIVALLELVPFFRQNPLPPEDSTINIDRWWHLAVTAEILKPGDVQVPQVAGEPLVYHWFSHLHMAIAGATSGVDLPVVVLRLWIVPVALATVAVIVALARHVSRVTWSGPLAVWLTLAAVTGGALWASGAIPARVIFFNSPSQTLTNLLVVAAGLCFVDATRRRLRGLEWVWLVLLVFACMGVKPTALTALLGGTLLATAGGLLRRRVDTTLIVVSTVLGLLLAFVMPMMSGSLSGKATLFASLESMSPYAELAGSDALLATSPGLVLESLDSSTAWIVALITVGRLLVGHATTLIGLVGLAMPRVRLDGASWWLAGASLSGWAAFLVVDHPSRSQFFFLSTVFVFGAVLTAWVAASLCERSGARTPVVASIVAGVLVGWLARQTQWLLADRTDLGLLDAVVLPIAIAATGLAVAGYVLARWLRRTRFSLPMSAVVIFMVIGLVVPGSIARTADLLRGVTTASPGAVDTDSIDFLSSGAQEAALWLRQNSNPLDVLATNAHCRPGQPYREGCDARGFWLSALSERRVLLEGWGYTAEASAEWGVNGQPTARQPSPWPDRLQLSQGIFTAPTQQTAAKLRDRGVTWLVGVRSAGPVANSLGDFASPEFENDDVVIYRLEPETESLGQSATGAPSAAPQAIGG